MFLLVREYPDPGVVIDRPLDLERIGAARCTTVVCTDSHEDGLALPRAAGPAVFDRAIFAAIEAGVLGKVVEGVAWTIEAVSNEMAAIIAGPTIGPARACLLEPRPG